MAYLRELVNRCHFPTCPRRAVVEVVDRWNGSMGTYCRRHGNEALREQQRHESKSP